MELLRELFRRSAAFCTVYFVYFCRVSFIEKGLPPGREQRYFASSFPEVFFSAALLDTSGMT
jgi:hypothetical protein